MELEKVNCSMDLIGKENVGYTLFAAKDGYELDSYVVLGFKVGRRLGSVDYVTWIYYNGGYNLGHYTTDFKSAVDDFNRRK